MFKKTSSFLKAQKQFLADLKKISARQEALMVEFERAILAAAKKKVKK
jgi:hypothetical protein